MLCTRLQQEAALGVCNFLWTDKGDLLYKIILFTLYQLLYSFFGLFLHRFFPQVLINWLSILKFEFCLPFDSKRSAIMFCFNSEKDAFPMDGCRFGSYQNPSFYSSFIKTKVLKSTFHSLISCRLLFSSSSSSSAIFLDDNHKFNQQKRTTLLVYLTFEFTFCVEQLTSFVFVCLSIGGGLNRPIPILIWFSFICVLPFFLFTHLFHGFPGFFWKRAPCSSHLSHFRPASLECYFADDKSPPFQKYLDLMRVVKFQLFPFLTRP